MSLTIFVPPSKLGYPGLLKGTMKRLSSRVREIGEPKL